MPPFRQVRGMVGWSFLSRVQVGLAARSLAFSMHLGHGIHAPLTGHGGVVDLISMKWIHAWFFFSFALALQGEGPMLFGLARRTHHEGCFSQV